MWFDYITTYPHRAGVAGQIQRIDYFTHICCVFALGIYSM